MFIKRARVGSLLALAIAASLVASGASAAGQQTPAPETRITIPAGDLITALDALAKQTRVELIYDRDQLEGLKTRGIDASLTPSAAVNKLIEGTPLTLRIDSSGAMVVAAPQPSASRNGSINLDDTLSEVIVTGRLLDNVSMMKRGETMRETPQSVTIMTQQRIEEQSLLSISEVIDQAPGMTVENDYYGKPATYYSRGFEISNMQIDGVSVDVNRSYFFSPNLAMYEQVEVLRGADGLFAGSGEPGGTINLVRKRGRADAETIVTAQGGSWSNFNAMLDVTGPLGFDGRLRGRAVATWRDRDYFYDTAHDKGRFFYSTLEADVTASTLLVVGGSHDETRQTPWTTGLPRHKDGSSLGLGRDKALAASWNRWEQNSTEVFARLEQKLGERWTLALSATHSESDMFYIASNAIGSDAAGFGVALGSTMGRLNSRGDETEATRDIYDLSLQGRFEWLGRQHTVLLGYDHQKIENNGWGLQLLWNQALPVDYDLASFSANSVPYPDGLRRTFVERNLTKKGGFYAKLQLQLAEPLKVAIGGRYASFDYSQDLDWYGVLPNPVPFHSALAYEEHDVFTPYVSVLFDVSRDWTLYGSVTEIYSSQANLLKGPLPGTSLDPISGRNYELGTKSSLRNGKLGFSFAVYRTERDGQAETDPAYPYTAVGDVGHSCCYLDSGEVLSQGIDTEVSGEVLPGLSMFAGYTLNENENKRANDAAWLSIAPKHIAKLWSSYRIPAAQGKWLVGGGVSVQSSRYFTGSARALNTTTGLYTGPYVPFDFTQGGYALWNAMARYDVNADWSVALNLNNILDKTYYRGINGPYSRNWYGEPRSFMVSLRGRF